jgi:hypothetical protein
MEKQSPERRFSSFSEAFNSGLIELTDDEKESTEPSENKLSQKPDRIFARKVLDQITELPAIINENLQLLADNKISLPFLHFTNDIIIDEDGVEQTTGNVASILENGFRAMDSNVGGFTLPDNSKVNSPEAFIGNPELFVKSLVDIFKHYRHHGSRLNHPNSPSGKVTGTKSALILISGKVPSLHGTDYLDHYILKNGALPNEIIGVMRDLPVLSAEEMSVFIINLFNILSTKLPQTS